MNKQPKALRLAAFCDGNVLYHPVAAELRRSHELNVELLEFAEWVLSLKTGGMIEGRARAVIAKAKGAKL